VKARPNVFRFDPESGAIYITLREGTVDDTMEIAEGAYIDIDAEGRVLGAEFLSQEEFAEALEKYAGLDLPDRIEDPAHFRLSGVA
jgi:uncharacterized protein YuzE